MPNRDMKTPPVEQTEGVQTSRDSYPKGSREAGAPAPVSAGAEQRALAVATAPAKNSRHWKNTTVAWAEVCEALASPASEKECGNWFFGSLLKTTDEHDGRACTAFHRNNGAVASRSAVTLDADDTALSLDELLDPVEMFGWAYAAHTTWRHTPDARRFRVIIPTNREMTPEEYPLVTRVLMKMLGADNFDDASAKPAQYMFRPSTQDPDTYEYRTAEGPRADVDALLRAAEDAGVTADDEPEAPAYDGPAYDALGEDEQRRAREYVDATAEFWRARFAEALELPVKSGPDELRWENLTKKWAFACAKMTFTPWTPLDAASGEALYNDVLPPEFARNVKCRGKWYPKLLKKVAAGPFDPPPWVAPFDVLPDDPAAPSGTVAVDVENLENTYAWLRSEVGRRHLSGLFRRGKELVFTPRIGEQGYVAPEDGADSAGPAQVWPVSATGLAARITEPEYRVFKPKRNQSGKPTGASPAMFPLSAAQRGVEVLDKMPYLRELNGVTHTPVIRQDGTILDVPGYDEASGLLYLPDPGFTVPEVPSEPTPEQVREARELLMQPVRDFPWKTAHDKANFLGAWFTPLLRPMVPPPYKLFLITAPQPGSGKGYLAMILRTTHGGVTKAELPSEKAEVTKVVVATLDSTTAPVVVFDNVAGTLRSSVLDALLTITKLDERILGTSRMASLINDRLWCATGNNVSIGGDIGRRLLRTVIDTGKPHPEQRDPKGFLIPDLPGWMRANRGEVLGALLTLVRAWVVAGRPQPPVATGDDYGVWVAALRGLLAFAGMDDFGSLGVGVFDYFDPETADDGNEELLEHKRFLQGVRRVFGSQPWTAKQVLSSLGPVSDFGDDESEEPPRVIAEEELPSAVAEKVQRAQGSPSRTLGKWLAKREGTWAGGLAVRAAGEDRTRTSLWKIVTPETPETANNEGEDQ